MWFAACAATSGGGRALFIDHRTTPENPQLDTNTTGDDLAYGFAGRRIFGQRLVTHTLCYLEAPRSRCCNGAGLLARPARTV